MDRSWIHRTMMSGVKPSEKDEFPGVVDSTSKKAVVEDGDLGITFRKPGAPLEVKIDEPKMSEDRRTASEDQ
ncbi:unnamed protein product [Caenorhabditis nigoni]|uniref:Uncharacterized protein n=1 Tax=Caenorhabditis nigoni TaxID=1611254 RepID=A0A2G5TIK5_9PELO|nr:hypothetical protein B9Z55_019297 [Caenorhabditis nigoni]